jgi:hypothetical protein
MLSTVSMMCSIMNSWYNYGVRAAMPKGTHNRDKADYINDRDAVYRLFSGYSNANMAQVHNMHTYNTSLQT